MSSPIGIAVQNAFAVVTFETQGSFRGARPGAIHSASRITISATALFGFRKQFPTLVRGS
jgi:hypothetical protein